MSADPAAEYAAAREAAALVPLPGRAVLAARGPQRQKFLHNMLSNAIEGLQPGQGCRAALLDVKGHLVALLRVLVTQDAVLLETGADRLARLEQTLLFYKVGAPVRFEQQQTALLGVLGPRAAEALAAAGAAVAALPPEGHLEATIAGHAVRAARAGDLPAGGYVVHCAPAAARAVADALAGAGALPVGEATLDALRVEDGRPWLGPDLGDEHLLHETGMLLEYHSPRKGCYVGQEVVARLEGRGGHVNKQVRGVRLEAPVAAGTPLVHQGREVGRVTTAALSPRHGPIALALVHRSAFEPGTRLLAGGLGATVVALPFEAAPRGAPAPA